MSVHIYHMYKSKNSFETEKLKAPKINVELLFMSKHS
jgi:hypothetical protein